MTSIQSVGIAGTQNYITPYYHKIGVDSDGNPVVFDPQKAKDKKLEELKEKQKQAIQDILNSGRSINPMKDKVFIDTEKGELTTIKPGIIPSDRFEPSMTGFLRPKNPGLIDPEAQEKQAAQRAKVANLLLGVSTLAAAFFFRKPIAKAAGKVVEYAKPLLSKGTELIGNAAKFVKNNVQGLVTKVVKFFSKGS